MEISHHITGKESKQTEIALFDTQELLSGFQILLPKSYHSDLDLNQLLSDIVINQTTTVVNYILSEISQSYNLSLDDLNTKFTNINACKTAETQLKICLKPNLPKPKSSSKKNRKKTDVQTRCLALTKQRTQCLKMATNSCQFCPTHIDKQPQGIISVLEPEPEVDHPIEDFAVSLEWIDDTYYLVDNNGQMYNIPPDMDLNDPIIDMKLLEQLKV